MGKFRFIGNVRSLIFDNGLVKMEDKKDRQYKKYRRIFGNNTKSNLKVFFDGFYIFCHDVRWGSIQSR